MERGGSLYLKGLGKVFCTELISRKDDQRPRVP